MIFVLWAMSSMLGNAEITFSNWQISSQGRYQQRGYFTLKASLSFAFELQCRALIMRCSSWALIDLSIKYVMHWCTNLLPSYQCRVSVFLLAPRFYVTSPFPAFPLLTEAFDFWGARVAQCWEHLPSTMWPLVRIDAICGLSLLLVLSFAQRGFSPGTPVFSSPQKPTLPNSNSIWNTRTRLNEFI